MVQHLVLFNLIHKKDSTAERAFFKQLAEYIAIVENSDISYFKQLSQKTPFDYSLVLRFISDDVYQAFLNSDYYQSFFHHFWLTEVTNFMEVNLTPLEQGS